MQRIFVLASILMLLLACLWLLAVSDHRNGTGSLAVGPSVSLVAVSLWATLQYWILGLVAVFVAVFVAVVGINFGGAAYLAHRDLMAIENEFSERLALWFTMVRGNSENRVDRLDDFDRTANKTVDVYHTIQLGLGTEAKSSVQFRDLHSPAPLFKEEALTVMKLSEEERKRLDAMKLIVRHNAAYMKLLFGCHLQALKRRIIKDLQESAKAGHNPPLEVVSLLADLVGAPSTVSQLATFQEKNPSYNAQIIWLAVKFWNHPSGGLIRFDGLHGEAALDLLRLMDPAAPAPRL